MSSDCVRAGWTRLPYGGSNWRILRSNFELAQFAARAHVAGVTPDAQRIDLDVSCLMRTTHECVCSWWANQLGEVAVMLGCSFLWQGLNLKKFATCCNVTFRGKRIFGDCSDAAMLLLFVAGSIFREAAMWSFAASADLVKLQGGWSATFRGRDNVGEVAMSLFVASEIISEVAVIEPLECDFCGRRKFGQVAASFFVASRDRGARNVAFFHAHLYIFQEFVLSFVL